MLVLVCGPSGVGKTSLMRVLVARNHWQLVPTITTRRSRPGEVEKLQATQEEYEELERSGNLFTSNKLHGNCYGTLRSDIDAAIDTRIPYLLDFPYEKVPIYFANDWPLTLVLLPDSEQQLVHQLRGAGRPDRTEQAAREYRMVSCLLQQSVLPPNVFLVVNSVGNLSAAILRAEELISLRLRGEA